MMSTRDVDNSPESAELQRLLEQEKEQLMAKEMVGKLTSVCWDKCITTSSPRSKLSPGETTCLSNCARRFLDMSIILARQFQLREPFINGETVPYDPKYHEKWVRNNARANVRRWHSDKPRSSRNVARRENMQIFQNRDASPRQGFNTPHLGQNPMPPPDALWMHHGQGNMPPLTV